MIRQIPNCSGAGLVYVPLTGRCETPAIARRLMEAARRRGIGFLAPENDSEYQDFLPYESGDYDYGYSYSGSWDWLFGGGGGDSYNDYNFLPIVDTNYPVILPSAGPSAGNRFQDIADWLSNWFYGNYDTGQGSASSANPIGQGSGNTQTWTDSNGSYTSNPGGDPVRNVEELQRALPGYCPRGTYHPLNDPYACVPFPQDDATKKKQAATQRQGQQQQARQQRAQQQQQNQTCPKDKQGRPVWRNPATQQCELVPACPQGSSFDQTTRRCLTPAQRAEIYGESGGWFWIIVGCVVVGLVFVAAKRRNSESQPTWRRRKR